MRCRTCGNELPEDAVFCSECGARTVHSDRSGDIVRLARSRGIARRERSEVPDIPEPAEAAEEVPEIPAPMPPPDPRTGTIPGTGAISALEQRLPEIDTERLERIREETAEAIAAEAEERLEELREQPRASEIVDFDFSRDVYERHMERIEEEPPPPPPVEERWADETRRRAEAHGLTRGEEDRDAVEVSGRNCCVYTIIALFIVFFLMMLAGILLDEADGAPLPADAPQAAEIAAPRSADRPGSITLVPPVRDAAGAAHPSPLEHVERVRHVKFPVERGKESADVLSRMW